MAAPVRLAVAQAGDLVISTYSHGPFDKRKVRMRCETVKKATPAFLWIAGTKYRRDSGVEVGGTAGRRKTLVDPTAEHLKLVAECDAEWRAVQARQDAAAKAAQADRTAKAKKASDFLCTCCDPEQMDHLLGEQILNDVYDALVREGRVAPIETH